MSVRQQLLDRARAAGAGLLGPFVYQPPNPWFPIGFYGSVALAFVLWNLLVEAPPAWAWAALPPAGFLLWTLLEYVLHSRFFHERAPSQRLLWLRASHGSHHEDPDDPNRIVARLSFSLPVALFLFTALGLALRSAGLAGLVMVGLIVGYLSYEVIHFAIHRVPWARRVLRPLVSHHLHHHHADPSRCFGVTTPLWDWVFRTGRRSRTHAAAADRSGSPSV